MRTSMRVEKKKNEWLFFGGRYNEKATCWQVASPIRFPEICFYSYASVSLTVNFEALLAGNALAIVARTMVKISQAMIPVVP